MQDRVHSLAFKAREIIPFGEHIPLHRMTEIEQDNGKTGAH